MFGSQDVHVMLDLETLGTAPRSVILQLSAVAFTLKHNDTLFTTRDALFDAKISMIDSFGLGFTANTQTVNWWHAQPEDLYNAVCSGKQEAYSAIYTFTHFFSKLGAKKNVYLWGNGANFDPVLLEAYYREFDLDPPWDFRNICCFRTLKTLHREAYEAAKIKYTNQQPHNALCDAIWQAQIAKEILDGIS